MTPVAKTIHCPHPFVIHHWTPPGRITTTLYPALCQNTGEMLLASSYNRRQINWVFVNTKISSKLQG